ncbi:hypothetical protein [Methanobrevibacter sp.]|uniref:hypothetical protein n=1 Tax=Methanobrevibacter sp. TaxID=66852 RepID=UPI00388EA643
MNLKNLNTTRIVIIAAIVLIILVGAFAFISLNKTSTKVEIECNTTVKNGDYISVVLKDDYRHPIPDQIIDLKILDDTGWANKYNVTTDEMGRGYIQLAGYENGNYTVHATYNGTLFNNEAHNNFAFKIDDGYSF